MAHGFYDTSTTGVLLQSSTPGSAQTGHINVSGTIVCDTISANTLSVSGGAPWVSNVTDATLVRSGTGPYTLGLNLASANVWTAALTVDIGSLGIVSTAISPVTAGVYLRNDTASVNNTQQDSPSLYFECHAWDESPGEDNKWVWRNYAYGSQGGTTSSSLVWQSSMKDGTFGTRLTLSSGNNLILGTGGDVVVSDTHGIDGLASGNRVYIQSRGMSTANYFALDLSSGSNTQTTGTYGGGTRVKPTFSSASALTSLVNNAFAITPTYNYTSSATGMAARDLWISRYEQSLNTPGEQSLIDAGTNSAASGAGTHTSKFRVDNTGNVYGPKIRLTDGGGFAIQLVAGENLTAGEVVYVKQTSGADGKVWKAPTSEDMPVGVVYATASADANVWVVTSGIVPVLPESGITAVRGYVMVTSSSEAGRVSQSNVAPVSDHWREVGHFLDTGSGNGAATRAIVHFN